MNEEELNKIVKEARLFAEGYDLGFQKGKLEQKKEELEFLKSIRDNQSIGMIEGINRLCIPSKSNKGRVEYTSITLDCYLNDRIKQLQKEIGEEK